MEQLLQWKTMIGASLLLMVVSLITGKFLKKAVLLLVAPMVRKSENKIDDQLFDAAEEDFGVTIDDVNEEKK